MPVLEQPFDVLRQFCHGDLDAFESLFAAIRAMSTAGSFASSAIPPLPKTSPSKPSGASIAATPASTRRRVRAMGATHRHQRCARLPEDRAA